MKVIKGLIPTIDLSDDVINKTIVDKEEEQYLGHVSTAVLSDKQTIFAIYVVGHGRGQGVLKKSIDGGQSWSDRLNVPDSWSTLLQVPVIYRTVDKQGVSRLLLFTGHYPIRMSVSLDNGETWSKLEPIGEFGGNVAMSDIIQLSNGNYMGFFHDDGRYLGDAPREMKYELYKSQSEELHKVELYTSVLKENGSWSKPKLDKRTEGDVTKTWGDSKLIYQSYTGVKKKGNNSKIYSLLSTDGGQTWSKPKAVVTHKDAFLAEAGVFHSPDKRQIAMLMRENTRNYNSFLAVSNDEGQSWSEPIEVISELTGDRHNICYTQDGRLVVTFRDTSKGSPTHGDWVLWVGTYDDIVNGKSGQYRIRLMKNTYKDDCGYAGLERLEDGTFIATSYGHWIEGQPSYIVSVRVNLEEIEEKYLK